MSIYAVWEFRFPPETAQEGLGVAEDIWRDMLGFEGYLGPSWSETSTTQGICWWSAGGPPDSAPTIPSSSTPDTPTHDAPSSSRASRAGASLRSRPTLGVTPSLFLHLANLRRPRRKGHEVNDGDRLPTAGLPEAAAAQRGECRPDLDELSQAASDLADAIVARRVPLPVSELNRLAEGCPSFPQLVAEPTRAAVRLERTELTARPTAVLAARVAAELGVADLARIKECARPECRLVFYDETRSRTQRWHAEAPCGRLERQRRHRTR